jgi:membrane-associated phospholipid phosphatase
LLARLSFSLLDLTGPVLTLLGEASITGAIAVVLAVRGWHHRRERGLGPLLLFAGVGVELLLKYILTHPGPPAGFDRPLPELKLLDLSSPSAVPISFPSSFSRAQLYSFPSGHMLRSTFLVAVASNRKPQWRRAGWLVVVAMAVTRVYCNEHWMSDVVGGALLGWTLAGVATVLEHGQTQDAQEAEGNARLLRQ